MFCTNVHITLAESQHFSAFQQTGVYSYPLGAGSARPNPKMGAPDPENPLFLGFSVLKGGLRPWSRKGPDHGVGVDPETVMFSLRHRKEQEISRSLAGRQ